MHFLRLTLLAACALPSAAADFTTFAGDPNTYRVTAIGTDANGNTYVTGSRQITVQLSDVFVSKLDPSGTVTLLATFSGKGTEQANGIALDSSGNIYIVGYTTSTDFPLHLPLQSLPSTPALSSGTGFLAKMSRDGTVLYSTYIGGTTGPSSMNAVAADSQGNAYVTGETFASDYPHTTGLPSGYAAFSPFFFSVAFFAKVSPSGDKILYAGGLSGGAHACGTGSSCFLSPLESSGTAIAVDPDGNAYLAGNTHGTGLPTTPGALRTQGIGAFAAKVNASGTGLGYVTLLGSAQHPVGINPDPATLAHAIAADAAGNAYLSGSTWDSNFPATPSAFQSKLPLPPNPPNPPPASAFVAKLNPTGSAMVWATFVGGADLTGSIALDPAGNVWVSGVAANFPLTSGPPGNGPFLAEFDPSGSSLLYATLFPAWPALAIDPGSVVHCANSNGLVSTLTPGQSPVPRVFGVASAANGVGVNDVAPGEMISIYGLNLGPSVPTTAVPGGDGWFPTALGGIQVTINGTLAPLLYVSETQIRAVTSFALFYSTSASLRVTVNGLALPDLQLGLHEALPSVFPGIVNQDGTLNSKDNPAQVGSFISVWATGVGLPPGADGMIVPSAFDTGCCLIHDLLQNQDLLPAYAGYAPGLVSAIVQINFRATPGNGTYATYTLRARINGAESSGFFVYVTR